MTDDVDAKVDLKELSPVLQEVRIAIPWDTVQSHLGRRYNELKRQARPIRGFRKGKAPRWVLEQLYGPQVQAEVSQHLLTEVLTKTLIENELAPVATPEVEPGPFLPGQPLEFTARIEIRPKIKDIKYEGLEIERPVHEVTNEEVDQELEKLREESADVRTPEPSRPARKGDVLVVDTKMFDPGEDEPTHTRDDQEVELGKGLLLDQVEEALIGASQGETKVVPVDFPDRSGDEETTKQVIFHITVKEIREKILPELDDEFAKDVSEHETLLELRLAIRAELDKKAAAIADNVVKDKLLDALCDANPVEVPPSLVNQQLQETQEEVARMLQLDLKRQPFSEDQTERMKEQGERKVRAALLMTQIARDAEIQVSDEAVEERLKEVAEQTGQPLPKIKAQFGKEERLEQLQLAMLQQAVIEHILSKVKVVDVHPEERAEATQGESGDEVLDSSEEAADSKDEAPDSGEEAADSKDEAPDVGDEAPNGEDHDEA